MLCCVKVRFKANSILKIFANHYSREICQKTYPQLLCFWIYWSFVSIKLKFIASSNTIYMSRSQKLLSWIKSQLFVMKKARYEIADDRSNEIFVPRKCFLRRRIFLCFNLPKTSFIKQRDANALAIKYPWHNFMNLRQVIANT